MTDLSSLMEPLIELAVTAGEKILEIYNTRYDIWNKDDQTPVTAADLVSHNILSNGLLSLTPDIPILSEEDQIPGFAVRQQWDYYWLLDPLDGTKEFIKGNGQFAICIALIHQHQPVVGVIHAPTTRLTYYAHSGNGAYRTEGDQKRSLPLGTSRPVQSPPVIAVSNSRHSNRRVALLERIGEHKLITLGSALKSCLVAEGKADLYPCLGPTSEWDTAAAQCIVEQAGGMLTDLRSQPLRYNTRDSLINPPFIAFGDREQSWHQLLQDD